MQKKPREVKESFLDYKMEADVKGKSSSKVQDLT